MRPPQRLKLKTTASSQTTVSSRHRVDNQPDKKSERSRWTSGWRFFSRNDSFSVILNWKHTREIFYHTKWWRNFPYQPVYLSHQPFGNCRCPTSVLSFSVMVHYGRATLTRQNHVIYETFATVSLWGWTIALISLPWHASFLSMFNGIHTSHNDKLIIWALEFPLWPHVCGSQGVTLS